MNFKKITALISAIALVAFMGVACSKTTPAASTTAGATAETAASANTPVDGLYTNDEYSAENMKTIANADFDYSNSIAFPEMGFSMALPAWASDLEKTGQLFISGSEVGSDFTFFTEKATELISEFSGKEEATPEDMEALTQASISLASIAHLPESPSAEQTQQFEALTAGYQNKQEIGTAFGNTYFFLTNTDFSEKELSDGEKTLLADLVPKLDELKNSIAIYPPTDEIPQDDSVVETETSAINANMNQFSTTTLSGETVTQDILADYDITMVNIWATWCGPCVEEMPQLQKVYEGLPENANFITICTDLDSDPETAQEIVDSVKGQFPVLAPDDLLKESLLNGVSAIPTTIFVDKNGNVIGDAMVGAPGRGDDVSKAYLNAINERLAAIGG